MSRRPPAWLIIGVSGYSVYFRKRIFHSPGERGQWAWTVALESGSASVVNVRKVFGEEKPSEVPAGGGEGHAPSRKPLSATAKKTAEP